MRLITSVHPHADIYSPHYFVANTRGYFRQMLPIIEGLTFLHSLDVIHGDLTGVCESHNIEKTPVLITTFFQNNILVDGQGRVRIADGMDATAGFTSPPFSNYSLRFTAPELLKGEIGLDGKMISTPAAPLSKVTDVYALAVVFWEVSLNPEDMSKLLIT
jgi:serine/threonine protein kinase